MIFRGYKIRVRCINWEQEAYLGKFWDYASNYIDINKLIGLGMNWTKDYLYFDYVLGVIDREEELEKLKHINFLEGGFEATYIEIDLPDKGWTSFKGKAKELRKIYDNIDSLNKQYDYELEYIDNVKNIEIKIHFIS